MKYEQNDNIVFFVRIFALQRNHCSRGKIEGRGIEACALEGLSEHSTRVIGEAADFRKS